MNDQDLGILSGVDGYDQSREIARLKEWTNRISGRKSQANLCWGLLQLIQQDRLRYGYCHSTSGMKQAFAIARNSDDMEYVVDAAYPDLASGGLLNALVHGLVAVETGYSRGQADLIFIPLARWLGPIHERDCGKPV